MVKLLVEPTRIIRRIEDEDALKAYVDARNLGYQLHGNLKQLCGWARVGKDRSQRKAASGYFLIEHCTFLFHANVPTAVALFGENQTKFDTFKAAHDVEMSIDVFKKLIGGKRRNGVEGWRLGRVRAAHLEDGTNLIGLPADLLDDAAADKPAEPASGPMLYSWAGALPAFGAQTQGWLPSVSLQTGAAGSDISSPAIIGALPAPQVRSSQRTRTRHFACTPAPPIPCLAGSVGRRDLTFRSRAPRLLLLLALAGSSRPPPPGRLLRRRYALPARSNQHTWHARPRCPSRASPALSADVT